MRHDRITLQCNVPVSGQNTVPGYDRNVIARRSSLDCGSERERKKYVSENAVRLSFAIRGRDFIERQELI